MLVHFILTLQFLQFKNDIALPLVNSDPSLDYQVQRFGDFGLILLTKTSMVVNETDEEKFGLREGVDGKEKGLRTLSCNCFPPLSDNMLNAVSLSSISALCYRFTKSERKPSTTNKLRTTNAGSTLTGNYPPG